MNALDILLLAIIAVSGLLSIRVGLIREAFALGALLIGLLAAVVLGRVYGPRIPDVVGNPVATQVLFFLASFVYILWSTTYPLTGPFPPETFFKVNPLVMVMTALSERVWLAGLTAAFAMLGLTFLMRGGWMSTGSV